MKSIACICVGVLVASLSAAATPVLLCQAPHAPIIATTYNSHFPAAADGGESFNGIGVSHDGTIYYTIDSPKFNIAGQMYSLSEPQNQGCDPHRGSERSGWRSGPQGDPAGQEPCQLCRVRWQALLRHPSRLLQQFQRGREDGHTAARLCPLSGRSLSFPMT